jgi:hypothetical protein
VKRYERLSTKKKKIKAENVKIDVFELKIIYETFDNGHYVFV